MILLCVSERTVWVHRETGELLITTYDPMLTFRVPAKDEAGSYILDIDYLHNYYTKIGVL